MKTFVLHVIFLSLLSLALYILRLALFPTSLWMTVLAFLLAGAAGLRLANIQSWIKALGWSLAGTGLALIVTFTLATFLHGPVDPTLGHDALAVPRYWLTYIVPNAVLSLAFSHLVLRALLLKARNSQRTASATLWLTGCLYCAALAAFPFNPNFPEFPGPFVWSLTDG